MYTYEFNIGFNNIVKHMKHSYYNLITYVYSINTVKQLIIKYNNNIKNVYLIIEMFIFLYNASVINIHIDNIDINEDNLNKSYLYIEIAIALTYFPNKCKLYHNNCSILSHIESHMYVLNEIKNSMNNLHSELFDDIFNILNKTNIIIVEEFIP